MEKDKQIIECKLLKFDIPDSHRDIISSDCKIIDFKDITINDSKIKKAVYKGNGIYHLTY